MPKFFSLFIEKFKTKKYMQYIIAAVLSLVVVIIFMSSCSKKSSLTTKNYQSTKTEQNSVGAKSYSETVENKLVSVLSAVKGCGDVRAMVVTKTSESGQIAMQEEEKSSASGGSNIKSPIYEKSGSTETPFIQSYIYPEITGVLIVASGAGDANVKLKIINAIVSVFGIDASKIEVLEGK